MEARETDGQPAQLHLAPPDEDLEAAVAFLEAEALLLTQYLRRQQPQPQQEGAADAAAAGSGAADAPAVTVASAGAPADLPREPLLLAEKQELCAAEIAAMRREVDAIQEEGELQRAAAAAAAADARGHQAAELARDLVALLDLLGLPQPGPDARIPAAHNMLAPPAAAAEPAQQGDAAAAAGDAPTAEPPAGAAATPTAPAATAPPAVAPAAGHRLPDARQLARADLHGGRMQEWMEGIVARHAAAADRLRQRASLLKVRAACPAGGHFGYVWEALLPLHNSHGTSCGK